MATTKKTVSRPASTKKVAAKKTKSAKSGGKRVSPKKIDDYLVLFECDADNATRLKAAALLKKLESTLEALKVIGICKMPSP